jgi:glycosyltransferase involved in cell wall biosynthesis
MSSQQFDRRSLHVMHVITPSRMAGAETFLARLLRRSDVASVEQGAWNKELEAGKLVPRVRCVTSHSPARSELLAAGVELEALAIGGKGNLLAMPRLAAAARRCQADLLHSHLSTASWWSGWLEYFGGPPSIGHVHGFTSRRWHARQSHLIACSRAVKLDLIAKGIRADRITVMHYPVDPNDVRPTRPPAEVRAELGVAVETPIVGTFAHLSIKKGYRELIRAAEAVLRQMPTAQFWCFGEGPLRGELEASARSAGIADRFRLLGFRRDAANFMQAIDVMCLPSHCEPFGLVYVEAGLAGKPVIACSAGGAPEIVEHGTNGLLVPSILRIADCGLRIAEPNQSTIRNPQSVIPANLPPLADAILTLLSDRKAAAAMGRRGRQLALERFGWPAYLSRLHSLYGQLLEGRSRGRAAGRRAA